jgi:Na+/H+ antiporter NhaC
VGLPLVLATVAATAGGGVFGDHCSPLSDTTVLSSLGSACDHMDHVRTQLPYALVVALVASVLYLIIGIL